MTRKRQQAGSYQKWGKTHYEKNKADYIARAAATKEKNRRAFAEFKATLFCTKCGESHPATLDFHHVIREPKNKKVHRLAGAGQFKKAMEEIKKCVVLCSNCHRKLHHEENRKGIKNGKSD